jgi:hypothetical protein
MRWTKDRAKWERVVIAAQLPKWTYATSVAETAAVRSSLPINAETAIADEPE